MMSSASTIVTTQVSKGRGDMPFSIAMAARSSRSP